MLKVFVFSACCQLNYQHRLDYPFPQPRYPTAKRRCARTNILYSKAGRNSVCET